jgi:hypothetical protein
MIPILGRNHKLAAWKIALEYQIMCKTYEQTEKPVISRLFVNKKGGLPKAIIKR